MYIFMTESKEEFANALIHGIGAVLFLSAAPILFMNPELHGNTNTSWPVVLYVFCLLMTYFSSTVYHSIAVPDYKRILRIFDHVSIFLLIGGTFTPIIVYNMGDWNGWPFLAVFWGAMICGIVLKIFFTGKYKLVSTIIYVGVAWIGAMFSGPVIHNMSQPVLIYLIIGGIFYTGGTIFYMQKKLVFHHAIWHLFVLAGSAAHYFAVLLSLNK